MKIKIPRGLLITYALLAQGFIYLMIPFAIIAWYFNLSYFGYQSFDMFWYFWGNENSFVFFKIFSFFALMFDFMVIFILSPLMIANYLIEPSSDFSNDGILFLYTFVMVLIFSIYPYFENLMGREREIEQIQKIIAYGVSDDDIKSQLDQVELIIANIDTGNSHFLRESIRELNSSYKNGMIISFMSISGRITEIILKQLHKKHNVFFKTYWTIGELHSNLLEYKVYTKDDITAESVEIINNHRKAYIHITNVAPKMSISEADEIVKYVLFLLWDVYIEDNIEDSDIMKNIENLTFSKSKW